MRIQPLKVLLLLATPLLLPAQTIDTIGGTNSAPSGANRAKASLFGVTTSVLLIDFEMYLDVPAADTLEFFAYRHHSRSGLGTLEWSQPVAVQGGIGPAWYSSGPIALPLIGGNHYVLGVAWNGNTTYYYNTATPPTPVSFGTWERAHTLNSPFPLPATFNIPAGTDIAQYHKRFTTVPFGAVTNVGTSCTTGGPRLVASGAFGINTSEDLELVGAPANALGVFSIALGPTLPIPVPLFGCSIWLDLNGPVASLATVTSGAGYAALPFAVPNNPAFSGAVFSAQAGVLTTNIDITNAIDFTVL